MQRTTRQCRASPSASLIWSVDGPPPATLSFPSRRPAAGARPTQPATGPAATSRWTQSFQRQQRFRSCTPRARAARSWQCRKAATAGDGPCRVLIHGPLSNSSPTVKPSGDDQRQYGAIYLPGMQRALTCPANRRSTPVIAAGDHQRGPVWKRTARAVTELMRLLLPARLIPGGVRRHYGASSQYNMSRRFAFAYPGRRYSAACCERQRQHVQGMCSSRSLRHLLRSLCVCRARCRPTSAHGLARPTDDGYDRTMRPHDACPAGRTTGNGDPLATVHRRQHRA